MKYFTEPQGRFVIKVPTEWQYKNVFFGYEEKSPFSFELYENPVGAFQISCYSEKEKPINKNVKIQKANHRNLDFIKARMDDDEFNMHLWYATVEDHMFMAKYIYDPNKENDPEIKVELKKVEECLATLEFLSEDNRILAISFDKYEKFMASLAASFDLKSKAIENKSLIEFVIITANQIDAYLRLSLVMIKQLDDKTNDIAIQLLYQGETDPPMMERKIYKEAKDHKIISEDVFNGLESLYKSRNKVVHRYVISEFKTRDLYQIAYEYEIICEEVRLVMRDIENRQFSERIGIYGDGQDPQEEPDEKYLKLLFSQVNDKHLIEDLKREIKTT